MKTMQHLTRLTTILLFATLFVIGCNKDKSNDLDPQQEEQASQISSEASSENEVVFNDVFDNVMGVSDDLGMAGTGIFGRVNNTSGEAFGEITARVDSNVNRCFKVTIEKLNAPDFFPVKVTIDFGTGCEVNGHKRTGKIITVYTKRIVSPGAKAVTTFENYSFDEIKVEGTHILTNASTSDIRKFTVVVEGAKLTRPDGNYSEWNSRRSIEQSEGLGTPYWPFDDVYKIEGSANGKVKRGDILVAWESNISEPLIKKFTCRWIVKGIIKVGRLNLATNSAWRASLDYGSGNCDNKATLTINGVVKEINLP